MPFACPTPEVGLLADFNLSLADGTLEDSSASASASARALLRGEQLSGGEQQHCSSSSEGGGEEAPTSGLGAAKEGKRRGVRVCPLESPLANDGDGPGQDPLSSGGGEGSKSCSSAGSDSGPHAFPNDAAAAAVVATAESAAVPAAWQGDAEGGGNPFGMTAEERQTEEQEQRESATAAARAAAMAASAGGGEKAKRIGKGGHKQQQHPDMVSLPDDPYGGARVSEYWHGVAAYSSLATPVYQYSDIWAGDGLNSDIQIMLREKGVSAGAAAASGPRLPGLDWKGDGVGSVGEEAQLRKGSAAATAAAAAAAAAVKAAAAAATARAAGGKDGEQEKEGRGDFRDVADFAMGMRVPMYAAAGRGEKEEECFTADRVLEPDSSHVGKVVYPHAGEPQQTYAMAYPPEAGSDGGGGGACVLEEDFVYPTVNTSHYPSGPNFRVPEFGYSSTRHAYYPPSGEDFHVGAAAGGGAEEQRQCQAPPAVPSPRAAAAAAPPPPPPAEPAGKAEGERGGAGRVHAEVSVRHSKGRSRGSGSDQCQKGEEAQQQQQQQEQQQQQQRSGRRRPRRKFDGPQSHTEAGTLAAASSSARIQSPRVSPPPNPKSQGLVGDWSSQVMGAVSSRDSLGEKGQEKEAKRKEGGGDGSRERRTRSGEGATLSREGETGAAGRRALAASRRGSVSDGELHERRRGSEPGDPPDGTATAAAGGASASSSSSGAGAKRTRGDE